MREYFEISGYWKDDKSEFEVELNNEENSIEGIKDYLIDNGLEDEINEFEFIQL